jgi:hypothetical protein
VRGSPDGYLAPQMLRNRGGDELILGMYWDYEGEQWTNRAGARFEQLHATCAVPVDWDADGDLDLVVGTGEGRVVRWENQGTSREHAFATEAEEVLLGGQPLSIDASYAMLTVADWDQDGRWDLVIGGDDGAVHWARNVGRPGAPAFEALVQIVAPSDGSAGRPGGSVQVEVADLDGDGRVDLLVGDNVQETVTAGRTEAEQRRYEEIQQELAEYEDVVRALYGDSEPPAQEPTPERIQAYQDLLDEMFELMPQVDFHGRVWLYARPPAR